MSDLCALGFNCVIKCDIIIINQQTDLVVNKNIYFIFVAEDLEPSIKW